jgi:integrase
MKMRQKMEMMKMKIKLTKTLIKRLRASSSEFTYWDTVTPHFGIRVKPTGEMRYIHLLKQNGRLKKTTIGDIKKMSLDEAREVVKDLNNGEFNLETSQPCPIFGDWTSNVWWPRNTAHLKPSTRDQYRRILDKQLIPALGTKPLDSINRNTILAWYEPYSLTAPIESNNSLKLLSGILSYAVSAGIISGNAARRIRRNPTRKITRYLSTNERKRLLAELDEVPPRYRTQALVVKMLLFTGCRRGEICTLRWTEAGKDVLNLADSKTGARTVWLGPKAIAVLVEARAAQKNTGRCSEFVFPNPKNLQQGLGDFFNFWRNLLKRAGIVEFRVHDLRHSFATDLVQKGVPLPVVSRLLGHSHIRMTARYAHASLADAELAAERIGKRIMALLEGRNSCR